jgi:hypothetical protein
VNSINVTIKGISPLLMHKFTENEDGLEKKPAEYRAERAAYRNETGDLCVPGINLQRCLVAAAAFSKGKGRSNLTTIVAACVLVSPVNVTLGTKTYEIDVRPVVIPATKGRVLGYRPRLDQWSLTFTLEYDETLLSEPQIRKVVDDAGSRVGLLDFRPAKKGPFGRFIVTSWNS